MTDIQEKAPAHIVEAMSDAAAGFTQAEMFSPEWCAAILAAGGSGEGSFDFLDFLRRKNSWSEDVFGPVEHCGPLGPLDHLLKEVAEAEADPGDVIEFADLVFLATDAAHRAGHTPEALAKALEDKLEINRARDWGDWRTKPADTAIEHNREGEPAIDRPAPVGSPSRLEDYRRRVAQQIASGQSPKNDELDRYLLDDRPAPVVVKDLEWSEAKPTGSSTYQWKAKAPIGTYTIDSYHENNRSTWRGRRFIPQFSGGKLAEAPMHTLEAAKAACQADYTRRILSAVNAVSAAQVQADERERLAKLAAKLPAFVASDDPSRSFDVAQWFRAQEGGK